MIKLNLPRLMPWQQEVLNTQNLYYNKSKTFVIKSSRQKGKSFLICIIALVRALQKPNRCVIVVSPTNNQNFRIWKQLKSAIANTRICQAANGGLLSFTLCNNSEIIFKSAMQNDALRGFTTNSCLIVDEAAFIDDSTWEIILPFISKWRAELFLFSTPLFREGLFYKLYNEGMKGSEDVFSFDWSDNTKYDFSEFITEKQINQYKSMYSPLKFTTEILGEFVSENSFVFGNFMECVKDYADLENEIPFYAGLDFATGVGGDSTVLTVMNDKGDVIDIWATNSLNTNDQIEKLAEYINERPTFKHILVESNSIGKVFYDALVARLNHKSIIKGFNTSNKSKRDIIEKLITNFQNKRISIPNNNELHKQLSSFVVKKIASGYSYENSSSVIHDDYVMSLALCNWSKSSINAGSFGFAN